MSPPTVADYVADRLYKLGIEHCFGAPGDFAFPLNDAIVHSKIKWLGFSNELNAAYAADGYARIRGAALICTTYAVGELSAVNGIFGAKAERSGAVFHLVGMPSMEFQPLRKMQHHTLGDGVYQNFINIGAQSACCHAVLTPDNVTYEMERLISVAMANRQPAYIIVAEDYATMPVTGPPMEPFPELKSDPAHLKAAVAAIKAKIDAAKTGCIMPAFTISRYGLQAEVTALIEATGLPFAVTSMDKAVISEAHPQFIGNYSGKFAAPNVRKTVEEADVVINAGGVLYTDFVTAGFSHNIDPSKMITIGVESTEVDGKLYSNVRMRDVFAEITPHVKKFSGVELKRPTPAALVGKPDDPISAASLYPLYTSFLKPNDIVVVESGTSSMGFGGVLFPDGAVYHNQTLWASIGWATGAAFGAALADKSRRVVLVTGDGAHQMTANELGNFYRHGVKPVIFVLNNQGYAVERVLEDYPDWVYNDVAQWDYHKLPAALGCKDWYCTKVKTNGELQAAMDKATNADTACYIEMVAGKHDYPPAAKKLYERLTELYGIET